MVGEIAEKSLYEDRLPATGGPAYDRRPGMFPARPFREMTNAISLRNFKK